MPSAATTFNNNNKEKRASVSSIGVISNIVVSSGGGNGQDISNTIAESAKIAITSASAGSQMDLTSSSTKVLKSSTTSEAYNPLKQVLVTLDHKIRNLEKRKTKLESYRAIQAGGKELSADQAAAVAKYDAVLATLDFARDLSKQTQQFSKEAEKEQKKQARKDNLAKTLAETAKIREVLIIQNVLSCFNDEAVRQDFLTGENGAMKLENSELEILEKFYTDVQTRRPETSDDTSFNATAQKAAEIFAMTINARSKPYGDSTFEKLRIIFQQIQDSGYLDKYYLLPVVEASGNITDNGTGSDEVVVNDLLSREPDTVASEPSRRTSLEDGLDKLHLGLADQACATAERAERPLALLDQPLAVPPGLTQPTLQSAFNNNSQQPSAGASTATPVHVLYAPQQAQAHAASGTAGLPPQLVATPGPPGPVQAHQLLGSPVNLQALRGPPSAPQSGHAGGSVSGPTTVRAVEHNYFKQQPQPHQNATLPPQQFMQQQLRPLAEVLGTGSFHFLQESELDAPPEVNVAPGHQQLPVKTPGVVQGLVFEASGQNHIDESQTIQTLTFTNQSFPSLQQQQQAQTAQHTLQLGMPANTQSQQQLFTRQSGLSPGVDTVTQTVQGLPSHGNLEQQFHGIPMQQQQPQPIIAHVMRPGVPQSIGIGMQPGDVTAVFPYDSAVVSYEQQLQHQLSTKQHVSSPASETEQQSQHLSDKSSVEGSGGNGAGAGGDVESSEWNSCGNDTNAEATAVLTSVLKTSSTLEPSENKWSNDMTVVNVASSSNNNKMEWQRENSGVGSGHGSCSGMGYTEEGGSSSSNHWNPTTSHQDSLNGSNGRRNSGNYQHRNRNGGGDERRDVGGRGDERGRNGGGSYRTRNYGNGGGGSAVYFRNNESGGSNSYYQNGGSGSYGNKESRYEPSGGGGSYRSQRGGNQRNGNSFGRAMGERGRNSGPSGGGGTSGNGGYMNPRQSQQQSRLPLGLENKN